METCKTRLEIKRKSTTPGSSISYVAQTSSIASLRRTGGLISWVDSIGQGVSRARN